MHYTVYDTPGIKTLLRWSAKAFLKITGWKGVYGPVRPKKFFAIAAPHTSNWDFPYFLSMALALDLNSYWMGKHTLFRKPFGWLFKWLGGLPIDRRKSVNTVDQVINHFNSNEILIITNAPEGTRRRVEKWKSGFYHISKGANIPIALAYLDYKKKEGGIGGFYNLVGDIEIDMKELRKYYSKITPKHPENFSIE